MSNSKPITDLSTKAVSIARLVDRLPTGTHKITIVKRKDVIGWVVDSVEMIESSMRDCLPISYEDFILLYPNEELE